MLAFGIPIPLGQSWIGKENNYMIEVKIDKNKTFKEYMLRNGKEMPYDAYMKIREKYGPGTNESDIYEEWIRGQSDNKRDDRPNAGEGRENGEGESISYASKPISIELEKAKYILENQTMFSKIHIEKAKKFFHESL